METQFNSMIRTIAATAARRDKDPLMVFSDRLVVDIWLKTNFNISHTGYNISGCRKRRDYAPTARPIERSNGNEEVTIRTGGHVSL
jgi:hypothetical protein